MNTLIIEHSGIIEKGGKMSEISKEKNCEKSSPKKKLGKMFTKNENCHNFFIYVFFSKLFFTYSSASPGLPYALFRIEKYKKLSPLGAPP